MGKRSNEPLSDYPATSKNRMQRNGNSSKVDMFDVIIKELLEKNKIGNMNKYKQ